jgi:hypothetical protein
MNSGSTDTRFVIPDEETRSGIGRYHNGRADHYQARHFTDEHAVFTPAVGRHHVDDSRTRLIPPVAFKAQVPLPPRPVVPEVVPHGPSALLTPEPTAPVTNDLLKRILRSLRVMR